MRSKKWGEALNQTTNLAVLGLVAYLLVHPGGIVRAKVGEWRENASFRRVIEDAWGDLTSVGSRIDDKEGVPLIVAFSDYECPFCRQAHEKLEAVLDSVGAGLLYLHLPLSKIHPAAESAARASICAEEQGSFREMHKQLFESDEWRNDQDWTREAHKAGVADLIEFESCLNSDATSARLARHDNLAKLLGVQGTPTFITLNGRHIGVPSSSDLSAIVR